MSGIEITMRRRDGVLEPVAEMWREDLLSIPEDKEVFVTVTMARNSAQHRWFFAMLKQLVDSGSWEGDVDSLLDYIKIGTGHVTTVIDPSGSSLITQEIAEIADRLSKQHDRTSDIGKLAATILSLNAPRTYFVLKSISFKSMDGTKFKQFLNLVERFLAKKMGIDIQQLRNWTAEATGGFAESKMPVDLGTPEIEPETQPEHHADSLPHEGDAIEDRLAVLSLDISTPAARADFDKEWTRIKTLKETRVLYREEPEAFQAIVAAARKRASGDLDFEQYEQAVNEAIWAVMDRRGKVA